MGARIGPFECKICGNEFMGWKGNANKYCSTKCSGKSKKKDYGYIECSRCGKELSHKQKKRYVINRKYNKKRHGLPYCSTSCSIKSQKLEFKCVCENCGDTFLTNRYTKASVIRGKYCSKKCKNKSQENKEIRTCVRCGREFEIKPSSDKRFCSKKCVGKSRRVLGKESLSPIEYKRHYSRFVKEKMRDSYIKELIRNQVKLKEIPDSLIKAKREHLKLKREIKKQ